jgi:hypothetical protein
MGALDVSCGVDTGNASPFLLAAENVALPHPHCVDASLRSCHCQLARRRGACGRGDKEDLRAEICC